MPSQKGGCAALIHPALFAGNKFVPWTRLLAMLFAFASMDAGSTPATNRSAPVVSGLQAEQVAIVVNDEDANSVAVANYYQQARHIPEKNVVHVRIPHSPRKLGVAEFNALKQQIEAGIGPEIQAIVLVWTAPYAVECNSITAALTLGFDAAQCKKSCAPGKPSPYFNSNSRRPYSDLGIRIAMMLPTDSIERAKSVINRGVLSEFRLQPASAYFLVTADLDRNTRAQFFPPSMKIPPLKFRVKTLRANKITGKQDIMIYQTGLPSVPDLDTLRFLPGALADHLTSSGGDLLGTQQMSSLRWLDAGATASYGTVSEPCNHWQKFPHPQVLLKRYLAGETAIEAYWKSLAWPAQGVVIGEPLAAPYRRKK
ncbi:MAG: TIGR03790 family protein [Gallionella sp.]|nr:TIGR03790 family protein [Gallionella sp.]